MKPSFKKEWPNLRSRVYTNNLMCGKPSMFCSLQHNGLGSIFCFVFLLFLMKLVSKILLEDKDGFLYNTDIDNVCPKGTFNAYLPIFIFYFSHKWILNLRAHLVSSFCFFFFFFVIEIQNGNFTKKI